MTEFGYKVQLTNEECYAKRFVVFHDEEELDYDKAGDKAIWSMSSQTCARCGANHPPHTYIPTDIQVSLV